MKLHLVARNAKAGRPGAIKFTVTAGATTRTVDNRGTIDLPDATTELTVKAEQTTPLAWSRTARYRVERGTLSAIGSEPAELSITSVVDKKKKKPPIVAIALARVRDVTAEVRAAWSLAAAWPSAAPAGYEFIKSPPLASGAVQSAAAAGPAFSVESAFLQVVGVEAPQLICVCWPNALARRAGARPTPFVICFRNSAAPDPGEGDYPLGAYYRDNCTRAFFEAHTNPKAWTGYGSSLGMPQQINESGKNAVLLLPLPKSGAAQFGALVDGGGPRFTLSLLREIQQLLFRVKSAPAPSEIGNVACCGFSYGCVYATQFVANVDRDLRRPRSAADKRAKTVRLGDKLKEVYLLGPGSGGTRDPKASKSVRVWPARAAANVFTRWSKPGSDDRRACYYAQPSLAAEYLRVAFPAARQATRDYAFSQGGWQVVCISDAAWSAWTSPSATIGYHTTHPLFAGTMLTDAMRTSKFTT